MFPCASGLFFQGPQKRQEATSLSSSDHTVRTRSKEYTCLIQWLRTTVSPLADRCLSLNGFLILWFLLHLLVLNFHFKHLSAGAWTHSCVIGWDKDFAGYRLMSHPGSRKILKPEHFTELLEKIGFITCR